ncbi:flavodoxin family protein [Pseudodesulfovibrio sp. zrk46]|uniref:flavodoxin family protein n=1 Tax=Pseudodesulfovibrio sp. zrk46 TaxID=2725288 RepID=UPI001449659B|nr:flavodoxin family protein [Pseudodesulfovibrio sp. zrk46]QJB55817.1 flavodoxin family protein [Pseudodesulfovibrio sp. zrk46]
MKLINIMGSPRKQGNSARIANACAEEAVALGAEVESHYLNTLTYRGCQGCEKCHGDNDKCVLKDDLTPLLDSMHDADIVLLSSPVYYGDTSGQFKTFLDRTWSFVDVDYSRDFPYVTRLPEGKKMIFILTQADVEGRHDDVIERYSEFFKLYGFDFKVVRGYGLYTAGDDVSATMETAIGHIREFMGQ